MLKNQSRRVLQEQSALHCKRPRNALVISLVLRMSMSSGDHLLSTGPWKQYIGRLNPTNTKPTFDVRPKEMSAGSVRAAMFAFIVSSQGQRCVAMRYTNTTNARH
ncbi:hypothetical protein EVAR_25422_1 [Eumeta japonica]|uniref:Uncharacterized protein n=1 Tax=Eumeta variegata TaxID=151549 RepID=A0A4C1V4W0_EUMVA|nr:hypothetical protein EVAR_25422_1 [Eumeta japonica]